MEDNEKENKDLFKVINPQTICNATDKKNEEELKKETKLDFYKNLSAALKILREYGLQASKNKDKLKAIEIILDKVGDKNFMNIIDSIDTPMGGQVKTKWK